MKRATKEKLLAAFNSGRYKKATGQLFGQNIMGDCCYCALGVLLEESGEGVWKKNPKYEDGTGESEWIYELRVPTKTQRGYYATFHDDSEICDRLGLTLAESERLWKTNDRYDAAPDWSDVIKEIEQFDITD